jgi:hypothetical protein
MTPINRFAILMTNVGDLFYLKSKIKWSIYRGQVCLGKGPKESSIHSTSKKIVFLAVNPNINVLTVPYFRIYYLSIYYYKPVSNNSGT